MLGWRNTCRPATIGKAMRQKRKPTLTRVWRGSLPWAAHWVASTPKWWLQTTRLSAMPRMAARRAWLQWRTSGPWAVDHGLQGALLEADVGVAERVTQGCHTGRPELVG